MSPDAELEEIAGVASDLLGSRAQFVSACPGGRNSRVYRFAAGATSYAVKRYPAPSAQHPDRIGREYSALTFLRQHGMMQVPAPVACARDRRIAVYEWLDGAPPGCDNRSVDELYSFFSALQGLRSAAGGIGEAAQTSFSARGAFAGLNQRRRRFERAREQHSTLGRFLPVFDSALDALAQTLDAEASRSGHDLDDVLPVELRCLSASDFGFHNALLGADGRLRFHDFEYFGWDDPAKAIADVLLHPGMELSAEERARYFALALQEFGMRDSGFQARFNLVFPIYGLIWCLIMLNVFLAEPARSSALETPAVWPNPETAEIQVVKATRMLDRALARNGTF